MSTFTRIFWLLTSILMIVTGVICFFNPGVVLISLAWLLGVSVLLDGISSICYYFGMGREHRGSDWLLFDGIVSVVLGGLVIFSNLYIEMGVMLPMFFSIWIICKGVFGTVHSFEMKKMGGSSWWGLLICGVITILLGIMTFIHPIVGAITIAVLVGCFFLVSGILSMAQWFTFRRF